MKKIEEINWNDPKDMISEHFNVKDATYLPSWQVFHKPSDIEKQNILNMAEKMETIREYLGGNPINVLCWIRPRSVNCVEPRYDGKNYNLYVGGATMSQHIVGNAVDFTVSTITCNEVRMHIVPMLETWGLRAENKPDSGWVHCDQGPVGNSGRRYFIP